jgi:hypothetical protein
MHRHGTKETGPKIESKNSPFLLFDEKKKDMLCDADKYYRRLLISGFPGGCLRKGSPIIYLTESDSRKKPRIIIISYAC